VREQVLYWVDIHAARLHRFDPARAHDTYIQFQEEIGCVGLRRGGGFIAGMRSGVWLLDADGRREQMIEGSALDVATRRYNDGRCDRAGRFWVGTIYEPRDRAAAALYRIGPRVSARTDSGTKAEIKTGIEADDDVDFTCTQMRGDITVSNGLAFAPDDRTLYHSDTPAHALYAYDFDLAPGTLGKRRLVRNFPRKGENPVYGGRPDGAAIDAAGRYWSAQFEGGRILALDSHGAERAIVTVPAQRTTMCAFGGRDLRTLFITTARDNQSGDDLRREPQSGGLFAVDLETPGLSEPVFSG